MSNKDFIQYWRNGERVSFRYNDGKSSLHLVLAAKIATIESLILYASLLL